VVPDDQVATPDFPRIYTFLASLFDPSCSDHVQRLAEMNQIDRDTTQILMHNMAVNMANQQLREQKTSLLDECHDALKNHHRTKVQSGALQSQQRQQQQRSIGSTHSRRSCPEDCSFCHTEYAATNG